MIFRIFAAILFIVIIVGTIWLGGQQREIAAPTTVEGSSADLGYSARRAVLIETGPDGLPMYTLNADVIRQQPGDGVSFEQVHMTFRDQDGHLWNAQAQRGELTTDTGKVELIGDVHVSGILPGSAQVADLATDKLAVDTHEEIISTAEPVVLNSTGRQLKSKGLVATLKERRLVLESSVHGTFSP